MVSIRREVSIVVPADEAWSALRDVGALHARLMAGFVTDCRLEGAARIVSFANGMAPIMAVEVARRGLGHEVKPSSDQLETMMKSINQAPKA